jgi:type III secretory pathway component EscT
MSDISTSSFAQTPFALVFFNSVFAEAAPETFLSLFLLFLARMLPIITQAPFFGSKVLPPMTKMALAIALFVIFLPHLLTVLTSVPIYSIYFITLAVKELVIGFIIGYFISMPFNIVSNAGILIDHQRGGASLMVNDPTIQNQSSPLGTLFNYVLIYTFYTIDAPFIFIDSIVTSYEVIPPDKFINPQFFETGTIFFEMMTGLLGKVMDLSIRLASPALIVILMTDFFLGIANRLAPQVQVTFLGMGLKSLLALAIVTFGWKTYVAQTGVEILSWLQSMNVLIYSFKQPFEAVLGGGL